MAETINRKVLDISHHNEVKSWQEVKNAGIVGIIHKATEGVTYVDPDYKSRCAPAMNAGLLWGAYHFANNNNPVDQVGNFLKVVGVDDETIYALDWEDDPNGNTMTLDNAKRFLQEMDKRIGKYRTVIYSGNTLKEKMGSKIDAEMGRYRMWLAQYGSTPVCQASWSTYWLWQYSDGQVGPGPHGCPGVTGYVDTNSYQHSDEQLKTEWLWGQTPIPAPGKPLITIKIVPPGSATVIVEGGA